MSEPVQKPVIKKTKEELEAEKIAAEKDAAEFDAQSKAAHELGVTGKFKVAFDRIEKDLDANHAKVREATNTIKQHSPDIRAGSDGVKR